MAPRELMVLTSGGLDSAILVAEMARQAQQCVPVYVRAGLHWEEVELHHLRRYLSEIGPRFPSLQPLVLLDLPVRDLYGAHWSMTGEAVPDETTPDAAVYLPGRNLLLTQKALLWGHLHGVKALALGVLASNPFPDASQEFFDRVAQVTGQAVNDPGLRVLRPFGELHKPEVMRRGADLPLQWSFSCIRPLTGQHCGRCNKCAERKQAFANARLPDPTPYWKGEVSQGRHAVPPR